MTFDERILHIEVVVINVMKNFVVDNFLFDLVCVSEYAFEVTLRFIFRIIFKIFQMIKHGYKFYIKVTELEVIYNYGADDHFSFEIILENYINYFFFSLFC